MSSAPAPATDDPTPPRPRRHIPLYTQVLIGVFAGTLLGVLFGDRPYLPRFGNDELGELGFLVIRVLKVLAIPLILFAILDAFLRTRIRGRAALRLVMICLVNVSVAFAIGLTIMNVAQPGRHWAGKLEALLADIQARSGKLETRKAPEGASLDPVANIKGYVPESIVQPFAENAVIPIVLMAVLAGAAMRRVKDRQEEEYASGPDPDVCDPDGAPPERVEPGMRVVERFVESVYQVLILMLEWVVKAVPFAVFGVVAQVVGRSGVGVFSILWIFLVTILAGFAIHALIYYPFIAWVWGRKSPRIYLGKGADAIFTGLSTNSSLATVPITLKCLTERMGVSQPSARLAACVGTNLNNDGITLYEAMTALFLAQALGMHLGLEQQVIIVLASIMAGAGVAGIPEAGLVVLPLVLGAAGIAPEYIALAIPLIIPVDWILARCRSGVNVMSDMLVAILLDASRKPLAEE